MYSMYSRNRCGSKVTLLIYLKLQINFFNFFTITHPILDNSVGGGGGGMVLTVAFILQYLQYLHAHTVCIADVL
jgi:hypothetical protein